MRRIGSTAPFSALTCVSLLTPRIPLRRSPLLSSTTRYLLPSSPYSSFLLFLFPSRPFSYSGRLCRTCGPERSERWWRCTFLINSLFSAHANPKSFATTQGRAKRTSLRRPNLIDCDALPFFPFSLTSRSSTNFGTFELFEKYILNSYIMLF